MGRGSWLAMPRSMYECCTLLAVCGVQSCCAQPASCCDVGPRCFARTGQATLPGLPLPSGATRRMQPCPEDSQSYLCALLIRPSCAEESGESASKGDSRRSPVSHHTVGLTRTGVKAGIRGLGYRGQFFNPFCPAPDLVLEDCKGKLC